VEKVIVISGGSKGLGKAVAKHLTGKYRVFILARTKDDLEKTAQELRCEFEVCDISDAAMAESAVQSIIDKATRIDCLINNATPPAVFLGKKLEELDAEGIKSYINAGVTGHLLLTKALLPHMKRQKYGMIININSQHGLYVHPNPSVLYSAKKWAMTGFTKSLQKELAPYGIGVVGMYPGRLEETTTLQDGSKAKSENGLPWKSIARTIEFLLSFEDQTTFPGIEIKHLGNM